jgi:hypothetical protein
LSLFEDLQNVGKKKCSLHRAQIYWIVHHTVTNPKPATNPMSVDRFRLAAVTNGLKTASAIAAMTFAIFLLANLVAYPWVRCRTWMCFAAPARTPRYRATA